MRVGFSEKHSNFWFDGHDKAAEEALMRFLLNDTPSLLLSGPLGVGKTAYLSICLKQTVSAWAEGHFISAPAYQVPCRMAQWVVLVTHKELIDAMHEGLNESGRPFSDTAGAQILIIDDWLSMPEKPFTLGQFEDLISFREREGLQTWITTNVSAADLLKQPGIERSYDRMRNNKWMQYIEITGRSRR